MFLSFTDVSIIPRGYFKCKLSTPILLYIFKYLCLSMVLRTGGVFCGSSRNESNETEFHVPRVSCNCYLQSCHTLLSFSLFLHSTLFTLTDENSESESDTEEKLKGEDAESIHGSCIVVKKVV